MPAANRIGLEAELGELRLAGAGIEGKHTRARLARLGIGSGVIHRGPEEWGTATRVHLS
jgi:hypothetical protein